MSEIQRLDDVAEVYKSEVGRLNRDLISHYTLELVRPLIGAEDSVLLMGIGDGYIASALSQLGASLTIVEGSSRLIEKYSSRSTVANDRCVLIESLFENFEPEQVFDVVVGTHVLEHLEEPVRVLRQTARWLSERGIAIFTVPNRFSFHRRIGKEMRVLPSESSLSEQDVQLGHRRVYDTYSLESDLRMAGYNQIEIKGYLLKVVPNHLMKEWSRDLLNAIFRVSLSLPRDICADLMATCRI
jgi:SAM-dependent methyltransferase